MNKENQSLAEKVRMVYALVASLVISGDAVDTVATIRAELREIYQEVTKDADPS